MLCSLSLKSQAACSGLIVQTDPGVEIQGTEPLHAAKPTFNRICLRLFEAAFQIDGDIRLKTICGVVGSTLSGTQFSPAPTIRRRR